MRVRRWVAAGAAGAVLAVVPAAPALAHPLGNFSVNTADRVVVVESGVQVTHVVDLAEIPTVQLAQASAGVDADGDGRLQDGEVRAHAQRECARLADVLRLTVDGQPAPLTADGADGALRPGQAGLSTARLECELSSQQRPERSLTFDDPAAATRTGWREVTAASVCGRVVASDVPADSPSALLTGYPDDLLSSPPSTTSARLSVEPGGPCLAAESAAAGEEAESVLPRGVDRLTRAYTEFVGRVELSLPVALLAVVLSVVLGAGHAVAPGHGKTVIAAYLVGQRGTRSQAAWLGATVTATHTAGVLLLGLLLTAGRLAAPERVVPVLEVLSGLLLAGTGAFLLLAAVRRSRGRPAGVLVLGEGDHLHGDVPADLHGDGHGTHPHTSGHEHGQAPVRGHGHDLGHGDPLEHGQGDHGDHDHDHVHSDRDHGHAHGDHDHGEHAHGDHEHAHGDHDHPHELLPVASGPSRGGAPAGGTALAELPIVHSHGGRTHTHAPLDDRELGWKSLAAMGVAGGLVPSPSALVVLLGATGLGRPGFGALLVVGYGVGMALTLMLVGLLVLRGQARLLERRSAGARTRRLAGVLPVLTSAAVVLVGIGLVLRAAVL